MFGIVLLSAAPQLLINMVPVDKWKTAYAQYLSKIPGFPVAVAGDGGVGGGRGYVAAGGGAVAWVAAAAWFGYHAVPAGIAVGCR